MEPAEAERAVREIQQRTGLPAVDPVRNHCGPLLQAIRASLGI
jgi:uncharacterized NAD-dependent epimerase/dehydratase family protein